MTSMPVGVKNVWPLQTHLPERYIQIGKARSEYTFGKQVNFMPKYVAGRGIWVREYGTSGGSVFAPQGEGALPPLSVCVEPRRSRDMYAATPERVCMRERRFYLGPQAGSIPQEGV